MKSRKHAHRHPSENPRLLNTSILNPEQCLKLAKSATSQRIKKSIATAPLRESPERVPQSTEFQFSSMEMGNPDELTSWRGFWTKTDEGKSGRASANIPVGHKRHLARTERRMEERERKRIE